MSYLVSEELLILCWNEARGTWHLNENDRISISMGGAVILDLVLEDAVSIEDEEIHITGHVPEQPLLAAALRDLAAISAPRKVGKCVKKLGTVKRLKAIRGSLMRRGALRPERRRLFGIIPVTRHQFVDPATVETTRKAVVEILTSERIPADAETHSIIVSGLAGPTGMIDVLVDRAGRKQARERAEALGRGEGVAEAVGDAIAQAQSATTAAMGATAAAAVASGSG